MRAGPVLAVVIVCVLTASVQPASAGSEKGWCAAVIKLNTKYGTMKKKRYLRPSEVTPRAARNRGAGEPRARVVRKGKGEPLFAAAAVPAADVRGHHEAHELREH